MEWFRSVCLSGLFLTALIPLPAHAQDDCPSLVSAAFEATGADETIRTLPAAIQSGLAGQLRPDEARLITRAFNPAGIAGDFRDEFTSACDPAMLRSVIESMSSPIAIRMRTLEAAAKSPQARRQLDAFIDELSRQQPPASRLRLVQRLDNDAAGAMPLLEEGLRAVVRGFGNRAIDIPLPQPALDQLHNVLLVSWLFAYRGADDRELEQYAQILETPAMKQFHARFRRAFLGLITTQAREMAYQIGSARP